jgi:hypothetical protein
MRRRSVVGCWLVSAVLSGCWYFEPCPDNIGGIKDGQLLETTIVAPYEGSLDRQLQSCGKLGDLDPGTKTTWRAHLLGSAETCDDEIAIQPQSLSGAKVPQPSSWTVSPTVTLADGCRGSWKLAIHPLSDNPQLLGAPASESPSWVLERTFQVSGDATLCTGGALPATCTDAFVAETQPVTDG